MLGLTRPTSGRGSIFGQDIVKHSVDIRKRIGYLAQDPRFYEHMTARETLRFKAHFYYRSPADEIEKRITETLELVGLSGKADRSIKGFSGGERQRLGIAQAQINYPDLLILDEPAAALDPMGRRDVLEVMERLQKYATIFYSTHILDDVQRVSDTVAILNHGKLVALAPIEELLAGNQGTIYSLVLEGDAGLAQERVRSQAWVADIEAVTGEEAFTGFDRVEVANAFKVDITQGATYSVLVRIDSSLEQRLEVVKEGNTLKIGLKDEGGGVKIQAGTMEVEITMPELTGLNLSGSSDGTINGFKSTMALEVGLSGDSSLKGEVEAGDASFTAAGDSNATLSGSGQNVTVVAEGGSTVDLSKFSSTDANVSAGGSSDVTVNAGGRLDADASGASHVYYLGDPTLGEIDTSGGSSVEPK